jgi:hypothetical protein
LSVVAFGVMALGLTTLRVLSQPSVGAGAGTPSAARAAPAKACRAWPLLVGHDSNGSPRRAYVRVGLGPRDVAMELDTGSATSYVMIEKGEDPAEESLLREVRVRDTVRRLPRRHVQLDPDVYGLAERGGLAVRGAFGAEEVLKGTTDIDLARGCLTQHPRGHVLAEARTWPTQRFSVVNGVIVTHVEIDGEPRAALFDTGVGYSILVTDQFRPYQDHQVVHDVRGLAIDLYGRQGTVRWGTGRVEPTRVERTPRFDTFYAMRLGDVHAMVGISSMGVRRIIVDAAQGVLRVEPRD